MTHKSLNLIVLLCVAQLVSAQVDAAAPTASSVPTIVKFSGTIKEADTNPSGGLQTLTFSFYETPDASAAVWTETDTVLVDTQGHYDAYLGAKGIAGGIPSELFTSAQTQWVGVTPSNGIEAPRVAITTAPYAFRAEEADKFGGKGPDEFVTVQQLAQLLGRNGSSVFATAPFIGSTIVGQPVALIPGINADFLRGLSDSAFAKLNVENRFQESQDLAGGVRLTATVAEPDRNNFLDSSPMDFISSILQPLTGTFTQQTFRWASQPSSPSSGGPAARLALFFSQNSATPLPTGLSVNSDGTINFALGQVFPPPAVAQPISVTQNGQSGSGSMANGGYASPIVNTAGYSWSETPPTGTLQVGSNTVTLSPCPKGVNGTDLWHYLYISKTGTPEAVLITGGSCVSRATSGTIQFIAKYNHATGYIISSATDGVQEATIDAILPSQGGQVARNVQIDPGTHVFHARLSVRATGITITDSAATITCAMQDTCIMLGDPANTNLFQKIVVSGLRIAAGIPSGTWPALEDNANGSQISELSTTTSPITGASFGSLIQIDNDQAAQITGITTIGTWSRCDTTFCSTAILGPGGGNNSGVLWVQNSNLSLNCAANGIDNQNGNTLHVSNTVVQAYPQLGIRARSTYGNNPSVQLDDVYEEVGNCVNPLGTGMVGLVAENGYATVNASVGPAGQIPVFANTGATQYNYSIVVHSSIMGTSPVYPAGYANTDGVGNIPVVWNQIGNTGVVTYDLLRTVGAAAVAPFGTGAFAIANAIPATSCANKICTFVDNAATQPFSYTVATNTRYWPSLKMWPGSVILTQAFDVENTGGGVPTSYFTDNLNLGAGIVNSAGGYAPSVFAQVCNPGGPASSIAIQCLGGNTVSPAVIATVLQSSGTLTTPSGLKGRMIFEMPVNSGVSATHVVTLADSNPSKTMATPNSRPSWDPNDTYIGYDQPGSPVVSNIQLSFGAPVAISNYIGNDGDNVSWLERLTKSAKTFQVPVVADNNLTVNGNLYLDGPCLGGGCGPFSPSGTQVSDPFIRPNGGLGTNWTPTDGTWSIFNNQSTWILTGDSLAMAAYTGSTLTFNANQSATVRVFPTNSSNGIGPAVRMSTSAETGYACYGNLSVSYLTAITNGTDLGIGSPSTGPGFKWGDVIRVQVSGTSLSCYQNGFPIITATNSLISSGYPGIVAANAPAGSAIDDFVGGDLAYTSNAQLTQNGATWSSGSGTPTMACNTGDFYTNTAASSASTVLYVCFSGSWTGVSTTTN
jgi:hypothetical protein